MGMGTYCRFFPCAVAVVGIMLAVCAAPGGTELATPRFERGARIVCRGEFFGHLQGLATDGNAIYWSFTRKIVKTDFGGTILTQVKVPRHGGDPCWSDGKLYVPVCEGSFSRKLKPGEASKNFIHVFDAGLNFVARHLVPELEYGVGGIAAHGGHFFVVGGRPQNLPGNTVYEYDKNFKLVRRHEVAFDSRSGIQTINYVGGRWYFGCYGIGKSTIETDENFRVLRSVRLSTCVGMIPLADGLVLVGRVAAGKSRNRSRALARVVRFTAGK